MNVMPHTFTPGSSAQVRGYYLLPCPASLEPGAASGRGTSGHISTRSAGRC
jgi:hypothetical protein